jgi:hypothetical protein
LKDTPSMQWLENHGTCGDHIHGGASTLQQPDHLPHSRYQPITSQHAM